MSETPPLCPRCLKNTSTNAVELSFRSGSDDCGSGSSLNFRACSPCTLELQRTGLALVERYERILSGLPPVAETNGAAEPPAPASPT